MARPIRYDPCVKLLPFPRWMIRSPIDLCPGYYTSRNYHRIVPTEGVANQYADLFALNIAHLENRRDKGEITDSTCYARTMSLINYYGFGSA